MKKRKNDVPHRRAFKRHHGRPVKPGYHVHHIDGDYTNNHPSNLIEVTPQEHYEIHKAQKDWGACTKLAVCAGVTPEELHLVQRLHGLQCAHNKVGIHSDTFDRKTNIDKIWANNPPGRKPVTDGSTIMKFRTNEEVETFLANHPTWRKGYPDDVQKGLRTSKRRITSEESSALAKKRLAEGSHNFTAVHTCPHCGKTGKGPMMLRWHFDNCKKKQ